MTDLTAERRANRIADLFKHALADLERAVEALEAAPRVAARWSDQQTELAAELRQRWFAEEED